MIVLSKEQIEEMVDPDQMMDQIEADQCRCALAAPAQLVLKGGDSALGQGNGAGNGCKQHQQKEQFKISFFM